MPVNAKREWMGIEPTWRLFSRHTGFEDRGGHQIRVHSPAADSEGGSPELQFSAQLNPPRDLVQSGEAAACSSSTISSSLVTKSSADSIGEGWASDLDKLRALEPFAKKKQFRDQFRAIKQANKRGDLKRAERSSPSCSGVVTTPQPLALKPSAQSLQQPPGVGPSHPSLGWTRAATARSTHPLRAPAGGTR